MSEALSLQILGPFRLARRSVAGSAGGPEPVEARVRLRSERLQALLTYLVLQRRAPVPRDHLAFLFWPETREAQALTNLRNLLHQLRQVLPEAGTCLEVNARSIQWLPDAPVAVDLVAFEACLAAAAPARAGGDTRAAIEAWRAAERWYRDDLLPGCYEDWIHPDRERLRLAFLGALESLIEALAAGGEQAAAVPYAQRLVRHDPLHEAGYRHLLALYTATGDRVAALRSYQACVAVLARELDAAPSPATVLAFERSQAPPSAADPRTAPVPSAVPPVAADRLPLMLTRFIGREREATALRRLLEERRLVTLLGPGGAGKTRLALQLARELCGELPFAGRVWWVDLAPVAEPGLVAQAWLSALEVTGAEERPEQAIAEALGAAPALVVVDNCEHVVEACAEWVAALLARCPGLKVLATSRERLGVAGEALWSLGPLGLPERGWRARPAAAPLPDAVALFQDRAREVMPSFALAEDNLAAVGAICRRLDGLPLAIELAAAAVRVLSVTEIARRLETSLDLPPARGRGGSGRHATLAAAIDWSYGRLAPAEQALFQQLSVFAGGFSLVAAEAVWRPDDGRGEELLALLAQLVDKSLVTVGEQRERTEYRLLESLRRFGWARLVAAGGADAVRARHAAFLVALVETGKPWAQRAGDAAWLARVAAVEDDVRAALAWCVEQGEAQAETLGRLATGMTRYWQVRGQMAEAERWLVAAAEAGPGLPPPVRALALRLAAALAINRGQYRLGAERLDACLVIWRALGDARGQASCLGALAGLRLCHGDYDEAARMAGDAITRFQELEDPGGQAGSLNVLGEVYQVRGDLAAATACFEEALALHRRLENRWLSTRSLMHLAGVAMLRADWAAAEALCDRVEAGFQDLGDRWGLADAGFLRGRLTLLEGRPEEAERTLVAALAAHRELANGWGEADCLHLLGHIRIGNGALEAAREALAGALATYRDIGNALGQVLCLESLAHAAAIRGEAPTALRGYAATAAWRDASGCIVPADVAAWRDPDLAELRAALGDEAFDRLWAEGWTLDLEAACGSKASPAWPAADSPGSPPGGSVAGGGAIPGA